MKKILFTLALLVAGLGIVSQSADASLWRYFAAQGEKLPTMEDRAYLAGECEILEYEGTREQNIELEQCLRDVDYWVDRIKNNETNPITEQELSQIPERAWKLTVPQLVQVYAAPEETLVDEEGEPMLGSSEPTIIGEFTCLGDECDKYITDDQVGFSVASRYKTTLASPMTSSQVTIPVSSIATFDGHTLTMADLGTAVFLTIEPGASKEEINKCTGVTSTAWTDCTRGLAFYGTSTVSVAANQKTHNAGSIVVMSNVHYVYEQLSDKDSNETIGGVKTFTLLPVASSTSVLCTTNDQFCTKYYIDQAAASGFNAANVSTTRGLSVDGSAPERVGINLLSTGGLSFHTAGELKIKYGANSGVGTDVNGLYVERGDSFAWTGTHTFSGAGISISPATNTIPKTSATTTELNRWVNAFERIYTAGEAIDASTTPQAVYLSSVDGKVYKASSNFTSSTFRLVGFVAKNQNVSTNADVYVTEGNGAIVSGFTALTTGDDLYVSTTGTIANSAGVVPWKIAQAVSTTAIMIAPAPRKYVGVLNQTIAPAPTTAASVTTTINVGFKAKKITFIGNVGTASGATISSKFLAMGSDPNTTNNPLWYEGTTYGFERDDLGSTLSDSSSYLMSMSQAANTFSRLLVLSTTQSAVTFLWEYRCNGNGNSDDNAWINVIYIIEE